MLTASLQKVLVIGGGDGGVLREVVKHDSVEDAVLCDIDEVCLEITSDFPILLTDTRP